MKNLETNSSVKILFCAIGVVSSVSTDTSDNNLYSRDELEAICYHYKNDTEKSTLENYINEAYNYVDNEVLNTSTIIDEFLTLSDALANMQVEIDKELVASMDKLKYLDKYKLPTKKRF